MIRRISANHESMEPVEFSPGFNLILAERSPESSDRDSRNGLGKSTLLEILHFCLGSSGTKGKGVVVDALKDWVFRVDLAVGDLPLAFSRAVAKPNVVEVDSAYATWPIQPTIKDGRARLTVPEQRLLLGRLLFGLDASGEEVKFGATFRSLFSYLVRRGPDGFLDPFTHNRNQQPWDRQVNVAYLLGLNWRDAAAFQELRAAKKVIDELVKATKAGGLPSYVGSEGELEAERVRLIAELNKKRQRLETFTVRDDYTEIEQEASRLVEAIHGLVNENLRDRRRIELYSERLNDESNAVITGVEAERLFAEAEVALPSLVRKQLDDLKAFHDAVVENRATYLASEIAQLEQAIDDRNTTIAKMDSRKSELMAVLESTGALEEYDALQDLSVELQGRLHDVDARLVRLREVTNAKSDWEARRSVLQRSARTRYDELRVQRDRAIEFFNANTEALYEVPGRLILDVDQKGFEFDIKIDRSDSDGVSNMKIFCFDLMVMQLRADAGLAPGTLIHDSKLFDGVDERQVANALDLAYRESERLGFQYICSLNSDDLPLDELGDDHPVLDAVAVTLHDQDPSGRLLGIEF